MLGLVFLRTNDPERAREAFDAARAADTEEPRYHRAALKRLLRQDDAPSVSPLFGAAVHAGKRLLTSGDKRLAEALREDALSAFVAAAHGR
jgi:hypothetical protein